MRSPLVEARGAANAAPPISAGDLVESARYVSGNFADIDGGLRRRVDRLVDWLNEQPPLSHDRKTEVELQLRKLLVMRLRLANDRARLPGIAQEKIDRPIFVIGFARTGTTLLHSL